LENEPGDQEQDAEKENTSMIRRHVRKETRLSSVKQEDWTGRSMRTDGPGDEKDL